MASDIHSPDMPPSGRGWSQMNVPRLRRGRPRSKVLSFRRGWCHDDDVELGRVRYARNGDVRIAYRVIGSGDATMVWTPGWISNLDLLDNPMNPFAALLQQLGGVTRIVTFDKRGTGLSDPVTRIPPLDERMDDLHAVMDAAGLDSPVSLFGVSEGGPMSILFAATFPERVRNLVLYGTAPRFTQQPPDWPWGHSSAQHQ